MTYADDGIPQHYYNVINDVNALARLRALVIATLTDLAYADNVNVHELDGRTICAYAGIDPLFSGQVDEYYDEWRTKHER